MAEGADLPSDLQRRWIVANVAAALVSAGCDIAGYFLRAALDIDSAAAGSGAWASYVAAQTALGVASFIVGAWLTAGVLRIILPALPSQTWIAAHAVIGLVWGIIDGLLGTMPRSAEPADFSDLSYTAFVFVAFAGLGAAVGAAVGGIQALVLRRVATGMAVWIKTAAVAASVSFTLALCAPVIAPERNMIADIVNQAALMFSEIAAAVIMLYALANLRPKTG